MGIFRQTVFDLILGNFVLGLARYSGFFELCRGIVFFVAESVPADNSAMFLPTFETPHANSAFVKYVLKRSPHAGTLSRDSSG